MMKMRADGMPDGRCLRNRGNKTSRTQKAKKAKDILVLPEPQFDHDYNRHVRLRQLGWSIAYITKVPA